MYKYIMVYLYLHINLEIKPNHLEMLYRISIFLFRLKLSTLKSLKYLALCVNLSLLKTIQMFASFRNAEIITPTSS